MQTVPQVGHAAAAIVENAMIAPVSPRIAVASLIPPPLYGSHCDWNEGANTKQFGTRKLSGWRSNLND